MMQKGLRTRGSILARAAPVFNMRGFFGTSIEDLVKATGLKKGGLYNHYPSKEALALAAFDYAISRFRERFAEALREGQSAVGSLQTIVEVMVRSYTEPVVEGGCPILNTAIESDDANPILREKAQAAMRDLLRLISIHVKRGIKSRELRADVEARVVATSIVGMCEGALMLSKLFDDPGHIRRARAHLFAFIQSLSA
jgi:TetR/AcrR family transcriptional regulator, transcriptional repressor for nem operon